MLKIRNPNHERAYHLLTTTNVDNHNWTYAGEEWKGEKEENEKRVLINGPISLHEPLKDLVQQYIRVNDSYSSVIEIRSGNPACFTNLSPYFMHKLVEKGILFLPNTKDLTGIIYKEQKEKIIPIAGIVSSPNGMNRAIGIGTFGAKPLSLEDSSDFELENGRLNDYVNVFLQCVWTHAGVERNLPDMELYFPPL